MKITLNYKKILFSTGMIAAFLYVLHVVLGGILWKGYHHLLQPISDLTASGSPVKGSLLILTWIYGSLILIFSLSFTIFESRRHSKQVFYGGIMMCILYMISLTYGLYPEDLPNHATTFLGSMHIVVTAMIVPFTILSPIFTGLGFRKEKNWKKFGNYSILSGILILILGSLCALFYNHKIPGFGFVERLNIGVLQLWVFIFSYKLTTK